MRRYGPGLLPKDERRVVQRPPTSSDEEFDNPEEELQDILGYSSRVTYRLSPIRKVRDHVGHLGHLKGLETDTWSFIYCECGWCMAFDEEVTLKESEEAFVGHVQPVVG